MDHLLAYIDPGSGSLIIQAAIAAIVAIPIFFRHHIGRIAAKVRRPQERKPPIDGGPDAA